MSKEIVVVFKDKKSREVQTFVNLEGHGAKVDLSTFLDLLAEAYGSPWSTLTLAQHGAKLKEAADQVIAGMKEQTREIAAITLRG